MKAKWQKCFEIKEDTSGSDLFSANCWLVVFYVPSTTRSFRDDSPINTVPCEGLEARFLHRPHLESNPGSLRGSPLHNCCAVPAP